LRDAAAFFGQLRFERHNMKDQFIKVLVSAGRQNAHPTAHPTVHVFGPNREMTNRHPQQSRTGQLLESSRWFLAAFAKGIGGFGRLLASIMVDRQNATIDGT
jgi:hypothetical protein